MSSYPNGMVPQLNPQVAKDLAAYEASMEEYTFDCEEIKKLAAMLAETKNGFGYNMNMINTVFSSAQDVNGDQVNALSALDNLDTDMRNLNQNAQSNSNSIQNSGDANPDPDAPPAQVAEAQQIIDSIDALENFLKYEQSLGSNSPIDQGTISNMLSSIQDIKASFTTKDGKGNTINNWGNAQGMACDLIVDANNAGTSYSDVLKDLSNAFQTVNQSTSALSTTTNTDLQYTTENLKQIYGIANSSMQAELKQTSTMIQNQKSN